MTKYYGIEVNHKDFREWFNWGKLYPSIEIAKEALSSIKRDNPRLLELGSEWRIFELTRII